MSPSSFPPLHLSPTQTFTLISRFSLVLRLAFLPFYLHSHPSPAYPSPPSQRLYFSLSLSLSHLLSHTLSLFLEPLNLNLTNTSIFPFFLIRIPSLSQLPSLCIFLTLSSLSSHLCLIFVSVSLSLSFISKATSLPHSLISHSPSCSLSHLYQSICLSLSLISEPLSVCVFPVCLPTLVLGPGAVGSHCSSGCHRGPPNP